jgi:hypothetical protein
LIQAAALASALIPLGAVAVEGATIQCVTDEADSIGCNGVTGDYVAGSGEQSNIWKFYGGFSGTSEDPVFENLLYSFEITGTPAVDFSLDVGDNQIDRLENFITIAFANSECIPLLGEDTCVIFNVFPDEDDGVDWIGTYYIEIRWFADPDAEPGELFNKPAEDGRNHIFRSADGTLFNDVLETELYNPNLGADPALGGRGDVFSSFIAGRADVNVPEPATLLLLGTGLAATLYRRRRR